MFKTKIEIESSQAETLDIRLIQADSGFKGLVLDMSKTENRLLYVASGLTQDEAWADAQDFVKALSQSGSAGVWQ